MTGEPPHQEISSFLKRIHMLPIKMGFLVLAGSHWWIYRLQVTLARLHSSGFSGLVIKSRGPFTLHMGTVIFLPALTHQGGVWFNTVGGGIIWQEFPERFPTKENTAAHWYADDLTSYISSRRSFFLLLSLFTVQFLRLDRVSM